MIADFMTSREIAHLTQTEHHFVLARSCDALIDAGVNPNLFWHDIAHGSGRELWLPRREAMISLKSDMYGIGAREAVLEVFAAWERNDLLD
jgi:hypothetical protein